MKIVKAYVRANRSAQVIQALQKTKIPGLTAYPVHGISKETPALYTGVNPFDPHNLNETVKIEVICEENLVDTVVTTVARAARTGYIGDGIIAVENVEKMVRIRDIE
jgi:nitrogen regulatory protein PII